MIRVGFEPQLIGGKPVGYLQCVVDITQESPKTSACKSSTLTTEPRCLQTRDMLAILAVGDGQGDVSRVNRFG